MRRLWYMLFPILLWAETGTLVKVIDGDTLTFEVNNQPLICQIAYVDTPENKTNRLLTKQLNRCGLQKQQIIEAGEKAKKYVTSLVKVGKPYKLDIIAKEENNWARCIVHVPKGTHLNLHPTINSLLIEQGYGVIYKNSAYEKIPSAYYENASLAKKEKRGLWKKDSAVMECLEAIFN